ncbi:AraC family transcriptional regulator [Pseudomonas tohonis]|uniref:AraC family transcriptional regulator n=1 Tax=Pseudomonas tohonis TaxID=2725477 RepID=A0A6J4E8A9_9PSED|nr:AraC family transcriptional regulator [Pseudomonas tohonis]BCG25194.1 AraC family transcriptional regulator [Pseudomonas tohonis]GJN54336.1 AraC family transcriptional regulator [Pseudomonas tohonis]
MLSISTISRRLQWARRSDSGATSMLDDASLLQRHRLLNPTAGIGEIRDKVSHYLWPHRMHMQRSEAPNSALYGVFFGSSALFDLHYGARVEIDAGDIASYYLVRVTLQGSGTLTLGRQSAAMQRGSLTVSSPSERSLIRIDEDCRNLILRVERDALERQLQRLLERPLKQPLLFDIQVAPGHPGMAAVRETLDYICRLHQGPMAADLAPTLGSGLSDYLLSVLLTQLPHNYSAALCEDRRQPMPVHVRRARDYIEEHLDEPIALATLAELSGVSIRTLQNGFAHFLQQSPTDYVRSRRLARVHEALQRAGAGDSVTDILLRHGVSSFGHFATHYRRQYGCLPSETLRSGR